MKDHQPQTVNSSDSSNESRSSYRGLIGLIGILLLLVGTVLGYFVWLMTHPISQPNVTLRILDRSEWHGEPPSGAPMILKTPIRNVIISHTATEGCEIESDCITHVQLIQNFHMASFGWRDIAYNFLVGGDGQVYVGRGWHVQGQHVKGYGGVSVSIAFIGTFIKETPALAQVEAAKHLMDEGVRLHKLHPDYHIYAHRQLSPTESPGEALYKLMKTWPRWSNQIDSLQSLNNETLRFVNRDSWLAQPAQQPLQDLALPVKQVRLVRTDTELCSTQGQCTFRVRFMQTLHIDSLHLADINYNFVIGGDGNIYVGRDWTKKCDVLSGEEEFDGLIIAFIAHKDGGPTETQMKLARALLEEGIRLENLEKDHALYDNTNATSE